MARRTLVARSLEHGAYDLYEHRDGADPDAPTATALSFGAVFDHVAFGRHDALVVENDAC